MIKDIAELNFPKIDGKQYATLTHATASLADMGEKTITTQVKIDGGIVPDFSEDWEVAFQGEKYIMPLRIPQGAKGNDSLNSTIDLTFQHWAVYQLKRFNFTTIQQIAAGTYLPDEEVATVQLNLKDFCILFGQVLDYYYGGAITIDFNDDPVTGWKYKKEATVITISHTKIWNVLIDAFHDKYGVRWEIKPTAENSNTVKGGERYVIRVGYPTTEVDHIFEYGFEGGLLKVERQVQSEEIRNMLKGRGGETNIPFRYFKNTDPNNKDFRPDPDWVEELANIYFPNLMPATFRSYIQGWKAAHINQTDEDGNKLYEGYTAVGETNAYAPWAYRKGYTDTKFAPVEFVADEITINPTTGDKQTEILPGYSPYVKKDSSIDKYGPLPDTLDNNDEIYPTLQGTGLDIAVAVEQIENDDVAESTESDAQISNIEGATRTIAIKEMTTKGTITVEFPPFDVHDGQIANIVTGAYSKKAHYTLIYIGRDIDVTDLLVISDSPSIAAVNVLTGAEHSGSGIPAGKWKWRATFEVELVLDPNIHFPKEGWITVGYESPKLRTASLQEDKWRNTFDLWVKNIWNSTKLSTETNAQYAERVWKPILGDREKNTAKVVFTSGELALSEDYEFTIVGFPEPTLTSESIKEWKDKNGVNHSSHWRITLAKSDAELEATGKYIPNKQRQGTAGDRFVFIGTEMTHVPYVVDAEKRLDDWKKGQLGEVREIKPTAVVTTDRVRLNNEGKPDALINQLRVGNSVRLFDKRFFNEPGKAYETLYLQSITYTYREPSSDDAALNPDVEIVLGTEYTTSANPVSMMQGEINALQRQVGSISNVAQIVRAVGDKLYLRKDGIRDRSLSPTQFFSLLTSGDFRAGLIGGAGWGFYKDENDNWVLEADRVNVRQEMQVNTLVINQAEGRGGMEIDTAAYIDGVTRVVETDDGYLCYFDQKNGSIANLFHVDDVAYCNRLTAENTELKFYKRRVTEVGADYVKLTKPLDGASRPTGWTDSGVNGTGIPAEGDNIIHFGNYTDATRRYVKVQDVVGGGYERFIDGLDSVNSVGTEYYFVGRQGGMYNGRPRFYIGDSNGYVEWVNGELMIKGAISTLSTWDDGSGDGKTLGEVVNDRVVDNDWLFILHTSRTQAPALPVLGADGSITDYKGWTTNSPQQEAGKYIWTTAYVRKGDGTAMFSGTACLQGEKGDPGTSAKTVVVNADATAFGYADDFATLLAPTQIKLTATLQGTTGYQWSYKTPSMTAFAPISGATTGSYTLLPTASLWGSDRSITLRCTSGTVYDEVTVVKVSSGTNGSNYSPNLILGGNIKHAANTTAPLYAIHHYDLDIESWAKGDKLTISACISVGDDDDNIGIEIGQGGANVKLYTSQKNTEETVVAHVDLDLVQSGKERHCFAVARPWNEPPFSSNTYIKWLVIQRGHTEGVDAWIPAASEMTGEDAYTVVLTNESHIFEGDTVKAKAASTECGVIVYKGNQRVAATIGTPTGTIAGKITVSNIVNPSPSAQGKFKVNVTTALTQQQGVITIPVTVDGKTFNKVFSWSLSLEANSISSIIEEYYLSDSRDTTKGGQWSTTKPVWQPGKYVWTRLHIVYTDGSETYQGAICNAGADGFSYAVNMLAGAGRQIGPNTTYRLGLYDYAEAPVPGKTYTLTLCYKVGAKDDAIRVYADAKGYYTLRFFTSKVETIEKYTFVCPTPTNSASPVLNSMAIYHSPNDSDFDGTDTYVKWAVLVEGDNPAKVWVPSAAESSSGVNELRNASFTNDTEHWAVNQNIYWDSDPEHSPGGVRSLRWEVSGDTTRSWRGVLQGTFTEVSGGGTASNPNKAATDVMIETRAGECWTSSVYTYCNDRTSLKDPEGTLALENRAMCEVRFYNSYGKRLETKNYSIVPTENGKWQRFHVTAVAPEGAAYVGVFYWLLADGQLWMSKPKLSRGTALGVWSPSPHDTDYLVKALQNDGYSNGGLRLASLIKLGYKAENGEYKVMSGLNGIYSSSDRGGGLGIWTGGDQIDAAEHPENPNAATAAQRHNGTAYYARNDIRFTENALEVGDNVVLDKTGLTLQTENGTALQIADRSVGDDIASSASFNVSASATGKLKFHHYEITYSYFRPGSNGTEVIDSTFKELHIDSDYNSEKKALPGTFEAGDEIRATINFAVSPRSGTATWRSKLYVTIGYTKSDGSDVVAVADTPFDIAPDSANGTYAATGTMRLTAPANSANYWVKFRIASGAPSYNTASWNWAVSDEGVSAYEHNISFSVSATVTRSIADRTLNGNDGFITVWDDTGVLVKKNKIIMKSYNCEVDMLNSGEISLRCGGTQFKVESSGISYRIAGGAWKTLS